MENEESSRCLGNSVVGSAIHYGWLKPQKEVEVGNDDQISLGHVHVEVGGGGRVGIQLPPG